MIRSIFGIEKSKKSFGHNFSRRKFFGFAFSAGAAAVVAPAAVEAALTHQQHATMSYIANARHIDKMWRLAAGYGMGRDKIIAAYMQPDPMFEMLPFNPEWVPDRHRQAVDRLSRRVGKHPALAAPYERICSAP